MTRATLSDLLLPARSGGYAIAGLVVLGWEDARTYVEAAEAENLPLILQAGPGFRKHMPLPVIAAMFNHLAENASVAVATHLDHSTSFDECRMALSEGFTSIMYDGSRLPLNQNIENTAQIVEMARSYSASCEGEIGFVGYAEGETGAVTSPGEAGRFASETGIDAMAVSVGNVHLQTERMADIDIAAIRAIEKQTNIPLVLHGGSGIPSAMRRELAATTNVCKFNIGTELRQVFGSSLRQTLSGDSRIFDRIAIMEKIADPVRSKAREIIRELGRPAHSSFSK